MPPTWVQDEDIWKEAKKAAGTPKSKYKREPRTFTEREIGDLKYPSTDEYWATVTHIYEKMGGRIKAKAKTKEKKAMSLADRLRKAASKIENKHQKKGEAVASSVLPKSFERELAKLIADNEDNIKGLLSQRDEKKFKRMVKQESAKFSKRVIDLFDKYGLKE